MADQKGSSSNPAKGLVSHLDRNRNLQQDRVVASSSASANSFRSQPQDARAASADANFANFTSSTPQFGNLPLRTANRQSPQFQPELGRTWLREFNSLSERHHRDPRIMESFRRNDTQALGDESAVDSAHRLAALRADITGSAASDAAAANVTGAFSNGAIVHGPALQGPIFQNNYHPNVTGVDQAWQMHLQTMHQQSMLQSAGVNTSERAEQFSTYPEQLLADNPGEAMEAAFAAYDQEFHHEMDSWMNANGPKDREDHTQNMQDRLAADNLQGNVIGQIQLGPSVNPNVQGSNIETYEAEQDKIISGDNNGKDAKKALLKQMITEDAELKQYAVQILESLNTDGGAEVQEKLKASKFVSLMDAIAADQAVVRGQDFVDPTSGHVIDDLNATRDLKGKGKMTIEELAKDQHDPEGAGDPSALA